MESKKISFGFKKTKKLEKAPVDEKREFIECVEEKSIKIVGGELVQETAPLVIPMKPNTLVNAERLKKIAEEVESAMDEPDPGEKPINPEMKPPEVESLDQMAVRELLDDAKKEIKVETAELTVPVPSKPVIDGEKESSLEDYESVPVQDFGMAMLRGMGWTPSKEQSKYKQPQLRPKGLGLGADKVVSDNQKKKSSNNKEEELALVKNSFVKITTGKHNGYYGKVVSLDEDNGRVMVDIPIKKETVSLSEFMLYPVTKSEYDKESKVINADSYEEYKKKEKVSQKSTRHDSPKNDKGASSSAKYDEKKEGYERNKADHHKSTGDHDKSSNGRSKVKERERRDSSSSEDRSKHKLKKDKKRYSSNDSINSLSDKDRKPKQKKDKKRYSSNDSLSSLSDKDRRRKHKSSKKRQSSNSESSPSPRRERRKKTPEGKRDIDKKRKGKKKKRDRDRSPNYKKYKK